MFITQITQMKALEGGGDQELAYQRQTSSNRIFLMMIQTSFHWNSCREHISKIHQIRVEFASVRVWNIAGLIKI